MPDIIRVRFATNRNPVSGFDLFGPNFRDNNPKRYVNGSIEVTRRSNLPDSGWVPDPTTLEVGPPIDALRFQPDEKGRNDIVSFARDRAAAGFVMDRAARLSAAYGVIFLHGFNNRFLDSISRAAQVAHGYQAADVFCFCWPSQGKADLESYKKDRIAAEKSAPAIADSLRKLFAFLAALKANLPVLHIVAHSLGNYVLRNAVQLIPLRERNKTLFESAFLMAAAENNDSLSKAKELGPLITLAKKVAVYKNGNDKVLKLSEVIDMYDRLGIWGPRDLRKLPRTVTSVDCSDVGSTQDDNGKTHQGHQYYRLSPWVLKDVIQVLAGIDPGHIEGRLPAIPDDEDGHAWWIPYDSGAGFQSRKRMAARTKVRRAVRTRSGKKRP